MKKLIVVLCTLFALAGCATTKSNSNALVAISDSRCDDGAAVDPSVADKNVCIQVLEVKDGCETIMVQPAKKAEKTILVLGLLCGK